MRRGPLRETQKARRHSIHWLDSRTRFQTPPLPEVRRSHTQIDFKRLNVRALHEIIQHEHGERAIIVVSCYTKLVWGCRITSAYLEQISPWKQYKVLVGIVIFYPWDARPPQIRFWQILEKVPVLACAWPFILSTTIHFQLFIFILIKIV